MSVKIKTVSIFKFNYVWQKNRWAVIHLFQYDILFQLQNFLYKNLIPKHVLYLVKRNAPHLMDTDTVMDDTVVFLNLLLNYFAK